MTALTTTAYIDALAQVIAGAVPGANYFAAGITAAVTGSVPQVVPLADDFTEAGMPAVTVALGEWAPILQTTNERLHAAVQVVVWRPRTPLGENVNALYADRDAIADAVIAHSKAYLQEPFLQSVILAGGPGIVPRAVGTPERLFLTLPCTVNCVFNRPVLPQPA